MGPVTGLLGLLSRSALGEAAPLCAPTPGTILQNAVQADAPALGKQHPAPHAMLALQTSIAGDAVKCKGAAQIQADAPASLRRLFGSPEELLLH